MSVAYAAPMYVGLSTILCSVYSGIECTKNKGKLDSAAKSFLCLWCVGTLLLASAIFSASSEIMSGSGSMTYLMVTIFFACIMLSFSGFMIYKI